MRAGVVLFVTVLVLATPAQASPSTYWSIAKVLRRIDGAVAHVGAKRVRIDSATTLCAGSGTSIRRSGVRMWTRFRCTYTTFTRALVDRDLEFRLRVVDAQRFVVGDAHWILPATASGS